MQPVPWGEHECSSEHLCGLYAEAIGDLLTFIGYRSQFWSLEDIFMVELLLGRSMLSVYDSRALS